MLGEKQLSVWHEEYIVIVTKIWKIKIKDVAKMSHYRDISIFFIAFSLHPHYINLVVTVWQQAFSRSK